MNAITQRLTAGFTAVIASAATLGATLVLFAAQVHAEEALQARPAAAQRYRGVQPADVRLDLGAATTGDVRTLSRQAAIQAQSNEASFKAASNEASFKAASNEAGFKP
jgi:hypothetical protein